MQVHISIHSKHTNRSLHTIYVNWKHVFIHKSIAENMDVEFRVYAQTNTHTHTISIDRIINTHVRHKIIFQFEIMRLRVQGTMRLMRATKSDLWCHTHLLVSSCYLLQIKYTYPHIFCCDGISEQKPGSKWKRFVGSNNHTPYTTDDDDSTHIQTFNLICTARSVYALRESEDDTAQSNS